MSQGDKILSYLQSGNYLTPLDALNLFGCFRLGARIYDLKKRGINVHSEQMSDNGKTFAKYYIPKERQLELI